MEAPFLYQLRFAVCVLIMSVMAPVSAREHFEQSFRELIADKALDRSEYLALYERAQKITNPEDYQLAHGLMSLLANYRTLVHLQFRYTYRRQNKQAAFLFSPTYSEDDLLKGANAAELLGKIAQQDLISETLGDGFRCGAASLLAGHFIIYGDFGKAFRQLDLSGKLTYRQIHLAQEKLYRSANRDGEDGLTQRLIYQTLPDGKVRIIKHDGEIEMAARKIGLHLVPLKITEREDLLDRQRVILDLWRRQPNVPLMVGVYLDSETGEVYQPNESTQIQNHFVMVFRQNKTIWMYNSGVIDNGRQSAIRQLDTQNLRDFVMKTPGSVNALIRYP
jgi:hypothetical protein